MDTIKFSDGAAYERYMGRWSQGAGESFLDWVRTLPGLRWLDVGCGNGAFTEMLAERCAPASIHGIDPSEAQLTFARTRPALRSADLRKGDAMALPFAESAFDAAVMPLVIFFVSEPAQGVAEMARVVAPGGLVCAYAWDMPGGGFPYAVLQQELNAMGVEVPKPPHPESSEIGALRALWAQAGLEAIEARAFPVERTFSGFDDYWETVRGAPSMGPKLAAMSTADAATLQERLRGRLPGAASGSFTATARCHAIRGARTGHGG
ncbi:MAG: class I SAM-dependent methyltransferase [Polyangia bacterium]